MSKKYKIVVPKAGASNELGTEVKLYEADEKIEAKEEWQEAMMESFVANEWAIEIKDDAPEEVGEPVKMEEDTSEEEEPKRARNEKGHYVADDPSTPDVNEAWEGGEAPEEKEEESPAPKKRGRPKKSTQKKS
tara:strand:- start:310 stop:708 length:399 start_codon:yes stop_codon:yes gene_type:complete